MGLQWPGQDASIPLLIALYLVLGLILIKFCAWPPEGPTARVAVQRPAQGKPRAALATAADELLGLFVDDPWLGVGAAAWVAAAALVQALHPLLPTAACMLFVSGIAAILGASTVRRAEPG